ncbi:Alcohol dehydrogenase GroES domain protein [Natrinema sp. J7-2]|nr:Alcohol dehydrogenase GroES domain protein [Natrinema sp. J7-2]
MTEAGAAGVAAVTAWRALIDHADLEPAEYCLVHGGVDAILDHRLDDYLQFDADVATTGARVVGIGEHSPDPGFSNDGVARSKDVSYQFMSMFNTPDLRVPLRGVAYLMETGALSVEVARTYDLEAAANAQRAVVNDSVLGKLVIEP